MAKGPEVKVKVGVDTGPLDKALGGIEAKLSTFAKRAGLAAGAAVAGSGAALVALTKASLANIDALAKQARSLGLATDAFQKMTMVAGEAGIEAGKLSSMLGLMQRNIDGLMSGTAAQVEAFGALGLSISDLQGLQPDEQFAKIAASLDAIADPTRKTALAMDVFGRSGRDAINMLSDYSAKAAEASAFQERFGIAVRQSTSDDIERANDAVGRLGMVMQGLGNTLAGIVAPGMEATANAIIGFIGSVAGFRVELEQFFGTLEMARAMLGEDLFNRMLGDPAFIRDHAIALDEIVVEMNALSTVAATAIPQMQIFADELDDLGEGAGADAMRVIADEMARAKDEFANGTITAEEFQQKIAEIIQRAQGVTAEFANINGANFSTAFANIQGLTDRLWGAAAAAAAARANIQAAIFEQSAAGQSLAAYGGRGTTSDRPIEIANPSALAPGSSPRPGQRGVDSAAFGDDGGGGGRGGGGGGGAIKDLFAERLKALQEGLQTEAEVVAEWYDEGLTTLQDALDRKMITEQEYRDLRERLEKEHQDRLSGIRKMGNDSAVNMALGAGQEILSAIGQTNEKALKIAKVFGAAQALISAYQGAAEALKLPFPKNIAAAAAVLAKGIGFANSIRSVNSGGGGGSSGGGATGVAPATAPTPPTQNFVIDAPGMDIGSLVDSLNRATDAGYRIRVNAA
jgi:hypothetical protein